MTDEVCKFNVRYIGNDDVIKITDFSDSLSGITDAVKSAYELLNGYSNNLEVAIQKNEAVVGEYTITVTAHHDSSASVKLSLQEVIDTLGFSGKRR